MKYAPIKKEKITLAGVRYELCELCSSIPRDGLYAIQLNGLANSWWRMSVDGRVIRTDSCRSIPEGFEGACRMWMATDEAYGGMTLKEFLTSTGVLG